MQQCDRKLHYPLLKLPLPGTGPEEYTTAVRDYSPPPSDPQPPQGDPSDRPDWDQSLLPVDIFRSPLAQVFQLVEEIHNHVHRDRFLSSLHSQLKQLHPSVNCSLRGDQMVHVHFKEEIGIAELIPLVTTYIILFTYIYFSTRKIDMVKSKWGLALVAVVTVLSSLLMSVGLCTFFGLTPTLNGGEIFPYLVVVIGLENVLFLTKSVVSTPVDLEVKLRIAQDFFLQMLFLTTVLSIDIRRMEVKEVPVPVPLADLNRRLPAEACLSPIKPSSLRPREAHQQQYERLYPFCNSNIYLSPSPHSVRCLYSIRPGLSNESWSIMKNMATELGIILIGYFTLVPAIQEFCLFAVVGLVSDFFLQMLFLTTVLSIDIRRMEVKEVPVPAGTVIWIGILVYTDPAGLRTYLAAQVSEQSPLGQSGGLPPLSVPPVFPVGDPESTLTVLPHPEPTPLLENQSQDQQRPPWTSQKDQPPGPDNTPEISWSPPDEETWRRLGPVLAVSFYLSAQEAVEARHPQDTKRFHSPFPAFDMRAEQSPEPSGKALSQSDFTLYNFISMACDNGFHHPRFTGPSLLPAAHWSSLWWKDEPGSDVTVRRLKGALSLLCLSAGSVEGTCGGSVTGGKPTCSGWRLWVSAGGSPLSQGGGSGSSGGRDPGAAVVLSVPGPVSTELRVATLGLAAGVILVLLLFCLYRVLCPRNYGQNGMYHGRRQRRGELPCDDYGYSPPISEISPLLLRGHHMDIECLASDGMLLVSCCLARQIRVWDAQTGDCLTVIPDPRLRQSSSGVWERQERWEPDPEEEGLEARVGGYPLRRRLLPSRPALFGDQPDLNPLIDTNFSEQPTCPGHTNEGPRGGFQLRGLLERAYEEHGATTPNLQGYPPSPSPSRSPSPSHCSPCRRLSQGDEALCSPDPRPATFLPADPGDWDSSVWALELQGSLIAAGRSSGKLELWDAVEGCLHCSNEEGKSGITALVFLNNRIVAARLNGSLDFFTVDINKPMTLLQCRGTPNHGSMPPSPCYSSDDVICCRLTHSVQCAHQKPITVLRAAAGRVVTGSQDHTVRVYRLDDSCCLFTLQGHSGGITALYIDQTMVLASGGQDGAICLWDVLTGSRVSHMYGHRGDVTSLICTTSCVISSGLDDLICILDRSTGIKLYSIQQTMVLASGGQDGAICLWDVLTGSRVSHMYGHRGDVTSLICTTSCVISSGLDDLICILDRSTGIKLYSIQQEVGCGASLGVISDSLLVTGGQGCVSFWDLSYGDLLQTVYLGKSNEGQGIRQLRVLDNAAIVCDFGSELSLVCWRNWTEHEAHNTDRLHPDTGQDETGRGARTHSTELRDSRRRDPAFHIKNKNVDQPQADFTHSLKSCSVQNQCQRQGCL
ncbi:UNVERIFIED_CONTAM: hypothetical protein FKN15_037899 [Acipenser sinensis]